MRWWAEVTMDREDGPTRQLMVIAEDAKEAFNVVRHIMDQTGDAAPWKVQLTPMDDDLESPLQSLYNELLNRRVDPNLCKMARKYKGYYEGVQHGLDTALAAVKRRIREGY